MKAMVLAAGLGTRLKPWTLTHPKALVPVGGVPMLERVILRLKDQGFDDIVVNIHHFGEQIIEFLDSHDFGVSVRISDERGMLLDTGGGLLKAKDMLWLDEDPVLVHNVDILSNADLKGLMEEYEKRNCDGLLLVSDRESGRKLIFDSDFELRGWHDLKTDRFRPEGFVGKPSYKEYAFSGIHVVGYGMIKEMGKMGFPKKFPVMDYYLSEERDRKISGYLDRRLSLIDIGKPESLSRANLYSKS